MANAVNLGLTSPSDYTGDTMIGAPTMLGEDGKILNPKYAPDEKVVEQSGTIPPIKQLRLKYMDKYKKIFTNPDLDSVEFLEAAPDGESVEDLDTTTDLEKQDVAEKKKRTWFKRKSKDVAVENLNDNEVEVSDKTQINSNATASLKDRLVLKGIWSSESSKFLC